MCTLDINVNLLPNILLLLLWLLHYYYSIIIVENNTCVQLFGYQYYNIVYYGFQNTLNKYFKLTKYK